MHGATQRVSTLPVPTWPTGSSEMHERIRAYDWAATSLGPLEGWPQSLKTAVELMLDAKQPAHVTWGEDLIYLYNDQVCECLGTRHPAALGRPMTEVFPEIGDYLAWLKTRVMAGDSHFVADQQLALHGLSTRPNAWFTYSWTPLRRDSGEIAGIFCLGRETTRRVLADQRARAAEQRQAFLLKLSDALRPLSDPVAIQEVAARKLGQHLGASRVAYGEVSADGEHITFNRIYQDGGAPRLIGSFRTSDCPIMMAALREGRATATHDIAAACKANPAAAAVYADLGIGAIAGAPLAKDGRFVAYLVVHHNQRRQWTSDEIALIDETAERTWAAVERGRAEEALSRSEARYRAFVMASADVIYRMSPDWSQMRQLDGQGFLADTREPTADWMANYIHPDDQALVTEAITRAIEAKSIFELEYRVRRLDGSLGWTLSRAVPMLDERGEITEWLGTASDVTVRRQSQERQSVLLAEIQHRTRNLIAMVRALAAKTMEGSTSLDDFQVKYCARLAALARVQGLLSHLAASERVAFDQLLRAELAAHAAFDGGRVRLDGPTGVRLHCRSVQTLALALHELATNAVKYGALGQADGRLEVRWHVATGSDARGRTLHVEWRESGVAMPADGARTRGGGYGRELIECVLPYQLGASTSYELRADGAHCILRLPIGNEAAGPAAEALLFLNQENGGRGKD